MNASERRPLINIGYIVGSTSRSSLNRVLIEAVIALDAEDDPGDAPPLEFTEIAIADLPLYNRDRDSDYPPEAEALKRAISTSDGVIIACPEYNRSIPGALKNALDWASRPHGENAFRGKPVGILGMSVGAAGTAMAQQHLRNVLAYLDAPVLAQPELFVQHTPQRFDEDGRVIDTETRELLGDWLTAFREWVERLTREFGKRDRAAPRG